MHASLMYTYAHFNAPPPSRRIVSSSSSDMRAPRRKTLYSACDDACQAACAARILTLPCSALTPPPRSPALGSGPVRTFCILSMVRHVPGLSVVCILGGDILLVISPGRYLTVNPYMTKFVRQPLICMSVRSSDYQLMSAPRACGSSGTKRFTVLHEDSTSWSVPITFIGRRSGIAFAHPKRIDEAPKSARPTLSAHPRDALAHTRLSFPGIACLPLRLGTCERTATIASRMCFGTLQLVSLHKITSAAGAALRSKWQGSAIQSRPTHG
jgi:hypothetical protein